MKNKHKITTILGAGIGIILVLLIQNFFSHEAIFEKKLTEVANELNKTCPVMIDKETRLDNTLSLPNNTFQYNYTLINIKKENVDIPKAQEFLKTNILNQIKTHPDLKYFRDNNVTMEYVYKDKTGNFILKLSFKPEEYKK